jgi:hypothetical protein
MEVIKANKVGLREERLIYKKQKQARTINQPTNQPTSILGVTEILTLHI